MPTSKSTQLPDVRHDYQYSKCERLALAQSHYYAELRSHEEDPTIKKPVVLQIARLYGIPESTLRRHLQNPCQKNLEQHFADMQVLTVEEEKVLVERLLFLDDFNVPADKIVLYELAHNLLHRRNPDRLLGRDWIYRFLNRHHECRYVLAKAIATNRANAVNWNIMDDFFWKLRTATEKYQIAPHNTYNLDEKGFILGVGKATKRICRNVRKTAEFKEHRNRESCTVVESISSDGFVVTPLVIFKGQNHLAGWYREEKEEDYWFGHSPKGFNNSQLSIKYLRLIFEPDTVVRAHGEWRMLIFDGFESHIDLDLIEFCLNHKILPFCLPAHTSHVLQPLDVGVFSALKTYYGQEVNKLRVPVDKNNFPNLLARARRKAFTKKNVKSGFRATGIIPYDPIVILRDLLLPEPSIESAEPPLPIPPNEQSPHQLITYQPQPSTPTTPRSIRSTWLEGLSTITSTSPRSVKQRTIFTALKMGAEKSAARAVMFEAGEKHLQQEILQRDQKAKADTRHVNSEAACILEKGSVLTELKRKRDERDAEEKRKKQRNADARKKKKVEKVVGPELGVTQAGEFRIIQFTL